tara:strand:+ start:117 stop:389 length:273 start_codon:yes stop_codon:yes gene_type:complete
MNSIKQTDIIKNIEARLKKLEQNSHPPVNWKELIHSNIERIEELESNNDRLIDIIKSLTDQKKELKNRLDVMEEILHSYIPIVDNNKGEQ